MSTPEKPANPGPHSSSNALVQSLIGSGHSLSHFYGLTLPPLFPLMQAQLGLSYTALGFLLTLLSVTTGAGQVVAGFLVDRFGARILLMVGLTIMGVGMSAVGLVNSYWAMAACVMVSGFGNCVFHPCDYVILNASVHRSRLGQAFSIHTFVGNVGAAVAPPAMILLASLFGWRGALVAAGCFAFIPLAFLILYGGSLQERQFAKRAAAEESVVPGRKSGWRLLMTLPFLVMFAFYVMTSMSGSGIQSFLVSAMVSFHGITLDAANIVLTIFLITNAVGILVGGFIADRTTQHGPIIAVAFVASAALAVFAGIGHLSVVILAVTFAIIGLLQGMTRPTRDIITRQMTPDRDVGKVFAFVSSGLNVGSAVAPAAFGLLLDYQKPQLIFWGVGLFMLLGVATIGTSRMYARATRAAESPAE